MKKPVEGNFQWIKPDGKPTQYFLELIRNLSDNGLGDIVSKTTPANGQFLVYSSATKTWSLQPATPPTNNQVLIYNSGTGTWVPGSN